MRPSQCRSIWLHTGLKLGGTLNLRVNTSTSELGSSDLTDSGLKSTFRLGKPFTERTEAQEFSSVAETQGRPRAPKRASRPRRSVTVAPHCGGFESNQCKKRQGLSIFHSHAQKRPRSLQRRSRGDKSQDGSAICSYSCCKGAASKPDVER